MSEHFLNLHVMGQNIPFPKKFLHTTLKRLLGIEVKDDVWSSVQNFDSNALDTYGVSADEVHSYIQYKYGHVNNLIKVRDFLTKTGGPEEEWSDVIQKLNTREHLEKRKEAAFQCKQINRCNIESYDIVQFYQPGWIYEQRGINNVPQVQPGYIVVRADQTFVTARPWVTPEDILALKLRIRKWLYTNYGCEDSHIDGLIIPIYGEL